MGRLTPELGRGDLPGDPGEFSSQLELDLGLRVQQPRISRKQLFSSARFRMAQSRQECVPPSLSRVWGSGPGVGGR